MRPITVKYKGDCHKCGTPIEVGEPAIYEKRVGIFCPGCAPTDPEEIRAYRQEGADRKADRYQGWADKRKAVANATLNHIRDRYRGDFAFNTQPGHIPERARVIRREDQAFESLNKADAMQRKANSLRHVRVAGDAERKRQAYREAMDERVKKGSRVHDFCFGDGVIVSVHKKSYRIKFDRGCTYARDKSDIAPLNWL